MTFWTARVTDLTDHLDLIEPRSLVIDPLSGRMSVETGRYRKDLVSLRHVFSDQAACDALIRSQGCVPVYEVAEFRETGSDLVFGATTIEPGQVGGEYFMTRGHFHQRADLGEVYHTTAGEGLLLLRSRDFQTRTLEMRPGSCALIPPGWAHRSVNVGIVPLVFFWCCGPASGTDYADIAAHGMGLRVFDEAGNVALRRGDIP